MKQFRNVLVAVESAAEDHPALERAVQLAEHSGASLKIVDTVRDFPWLARTLTPDYSHVAELLVQEMGQRLEELAEPLRQRGLDVSTRALRGKLSIEIIREVLRGEHDLVIKATKGLHSRREGPFGATGMGLLRNCPTAVWLVQPQHRGGYEQVLAAVDANPYDETHAQLSQEILDLATSFLKETEGCRLNVVYAWSVFGADLLRRRMSEEEFRELGKTSEEEHRKSFAALLEPYGLSVEEEGVYLEQGEPSQVIPRIVIEHEVDLVVMGTVARTGMVGVLMGNTADAILQRLNCSVLALKPEGFESPITLETE